MPKVTIEDVATRARVSIKTVSRVVNNEPNVSESTRRKVNAAISTLNYRPNQSARRLKSQRSFLIGLVYDDPSAYEIPSSGYVINMQQGLLSVCKEANYDLLIHPCGFSDRRIAAEIKGLIEHSRLDGIVLAPPLSNMRGIVKAIENTGTPFVGISPGGSTLRQPAVATNDREICAEMTAHLASLGHRRIAFITGHPDHKAVASRFLGFQDGLRDCGLKLDAALVGSGDNSIESGERCARTLLDLARPPTAIFAANDDMAAGVIRVAHERRIRIPERLSVAGFDDVPLARQIYPSLTTVNQPLAKMAEHAARRLIRMLHSGEASLDLEVIPSALVLRDSTGLAP
ncbi:MAG: LacI family DNA-binding transcriptional regulator [Gammaproteobacteria bacterium]|nr:LacI family DNA-binding transcriptional regulator [Gammaproteobacteria bacterium]MDH4257093.1 LacI family DNA-binding transcriptional regulator [Gammaproteobacteria bacterium]MDH5311672.1 LacI family DNA-binding transcriptional regulator [Gammaproteobacteria bacterium]